MQGLMKFHQGLLKILRKQNVTDGRTDGWTDNVKTVYPPTNTVCGGYKNVKVLIAAILSIILFWEPNSFMHMFNVSALLRQSIKMFYQKL